MNFRLGNMYRSCGCGVFKFFGLKTLRTWQLAVSSGVIIRETFAYLDNFFWLIAI